MNDKPQLLQVLMSLFNDSPELEGEVIKMTDSKELLNELQKTGLNGQALDQAFVWLEKFAKLNEEDSLDYHTDTIRVFTNAEKSIIPQECLNFLQEAYFVGDIQPHELEFIIEQIMTLSTHTVTEDQFMWIFDMTIANQADESPCSSMTLHELASTSLYLH